MRRFKAAVTGLLPLISLGLSLPSIPSFSLDNTGAAANTRDVSLHLSVPCHGCSDRREDELVLNLRVHASEAGCTNDHVSINGQHLQQTWNGQAGYGAGNVQSILSDSLVERESPARWESTCVPHESNGEDVQVLTFLIDQPEGSQRGHPVGFTLSFNPGPDPEILRLTHGVNELPRGEISLQAWTDPSVEDRFSSLPQPEQSALEVELHELHELKQQSHDLHDQIKEKKKSVRKLLKQDLRSFRSQLKECDSIRCVWSNVLGKLPGMAHSVAAYFQHPIEEQRPRLPSLLHGHHPDGIQKHHSHPPPSSEGPIGDEHHSLPPLGPDADTFDEPFTNTHDELDSPSMGTESFSHSPPPPPHEPQLPHSPDQPVPPQGPHHDGEPFSHSPPPHEDDSPTPHHGDHPPPPHHGNFPHPPMPSGHPDHPPHHGPFDEHHPPNGIPPPPPIPPFGPHHAPDRPPPGPHHHRHHVKHFLPLVVLALLCTFLFVHLRRRVFMKRRRADRGFRREERSARRSIRRAARRQRWSQWWNRYRKPTCQADFEEKRAHVVSQEDVLESAMQAELRDLQRAHEIVDELVRARGSRGRMAMLANMPARATTPAELEAGVAGSSQFSSDSEELPPPRYSEDLLRDEIQVADGFMYTPSATDETPDSSVVDCSPRLSLDTARTRASSSASRDGTNEK